MNAPPWLVSCEWCLRVQVAGTWVQWPAAIDRDEGGISHSICEECREKNFPKVGK